jgi:transcription termination factor NusB
MNTATDIQLAEALLTSLARVIVRNSKDHDEMVSQFITTCTIYRIELMTNMAENLWQKVLTVQEGNK